MRFSSILAATLVTLSLGAIAHPIEELEERGGKKSSPSYTVTKFGNINVLTDNNGAFAGLISQEAKWGGDNSATVGASQANDIHQSQKRGGKGGDKYPSGFNVVKVGNVNILTDNNGAFAGIIAQSAKKGGSNSATVGASQENDITQSQKRGGKSGDKYSSGWNVVKVGNVNILTDNNGAFAGVIAQSSKGGSNDAGVIAQQANTIHQSQ
ncbi:hypothetical protein IAU59_001676 [Kwoniella sp. CBS 9459]